MQGHTVPLAPLILAGVICWAPGFAGAQASNPPGSGVLQPAPVLESREFVIRGGTANVQSVQGPRRGLAPKPEPAAEVERAAVPLDPALRALMAERLRNQRQLFLSATVYDHQRTLLRWWAGNAPARAFAAWSNVDFNHCAGMGGFEHAGTRYMLFLSVGNQDTARLSARMEAAGRVYVPPQIPELSTAEPAFVVVEGDPDDTEGIQPITAIHDYYKAERFRLAAAWQQREQDRLAHAAWLKANPPPPVHRVLRHYAVQPEKNVPQRLLGGER